MQRDIRASAREIAAIAAVADKQNIPHHYPDKNQQYIKI